jgi:hypothetical protein
VLVVSSRKCAATSNPNTGLGFGYDIRENKSVVKVGLNLRFGGGPVVAKY